MAKRIMVVDDEPDIIETVRSVLESKGYRVTEAHTGDECLKKAQQEKPDLVLMDIMMPGTPVRDIVPKLRGIKVAYLSVVRVGEAEKENLLKTKNVVAFVQKPFDVNALLAKVKKIVGE